MTESRTILTRDGRHRVVLTPTERDLAMHADASYWAPAIFDGEACVFQLPGWNAITTIPWGAGGVQFRLARSDSAVERFLIVDPLQRRFCLDPGLSLQLWNEELPEENVLWHKDWAAIYQIIEQVFERAESEARRLEPSVEERFSIEYEEVELSMVHKAYYGSVVDGGRVVMSLPSGRWHEIESGNILELLPAGANKDYCLRYDSATERVCWVHRASGRQGPWLPAHKCSEAWSKRS